MERKNSFRPIDIANLPQSGDRPLEVALVRGQAVESRHRVHVQVADRHGNELHRWGNPQLTFYPRSAVKLIQAVPWVAAGFAKKWQVSQEELAIACGSHHGEEFHVRTVEGWLKRLGLNVESLECGVHFPYSEASAHAIIRKGEKPCAIHNNCSGKHAGLLLECLSLGLDPKGYSNFDHPVQVKNREMLGQFLGRDMDECSWGIDGCGIPTYAITIEQLALAMARISDPVDLGSDIQEAVQSLVAAIASEAKFIGGSSSFCSRVVTETEGRVFAKVGAEGVYGAWIPAAGIGIAMKCEDGLAGAAEVAMAAVLRELGHPLQFFSPLVRRWTGEVVGQFVCA